MVRRFDGYGDTRINWQQGFPQAWEPVKINVLEVVKPCEGMLLSFVKVCCLK